MFSKSLNNLVMLINKNSKENKDEFKTISYSYDEPFLQILVTAGAIRGFCFFTAKTSIGYNKLFVRVLLKKLPPYNAGLLIKTFPYKFQIKNINRHKLVLLIKKYPSSTFILNTRFGLLSEKAALNKNSFGVLMFKLN